jgi:hypothetical protein
MKADYSAKIRKSVLKTQGGKNEIFQIKGIKPVDPIHSFASFCGSIGYWC